MPIKRSWLSAALCEGCGVVEATCNFAGFQRYSPMQGTAPTLAIMWIGMFSAIAIWACLINEENHPDVHRVCGVLQEWSGPLWNGSK